jgi:hypothetical protein
LCGYKDGGFYENTYDFIGDPFYHDCAEYEISLTIPKDYTLASGCNIKEEKALESKKKYTMSAMNDTNAVKFTAEEEEAIAALTGLGFTKNESMQAVKRAKETGAVSVEDIIRKALQGGI